MGDDVSSEGLERWAADARAAEVVDARVRERWLRTQAVESSTLAGTLVALAEQSAAVVVTTSTGRHHAGCVTMVGADFLAVQRNERISLISFAALASVEPSEPARAVPIEGEPRPTSPNAPTAATLTDVLARAVGDRRRLMLYAGDTRVTGQLLAIGADIATVRTDGDPAGLAYVPVASVSEASFLDSG
ncbi:MAG TPA: hypothetical protein VM121_02775 [Acidimicrobiales bacterium]|nr:hypothetical protein [Acidimicrobiales bacterium]